MTKGRKGGKGNLRAKNRTRAPPHYSQGLGSETVCWAEKGRDVAGDMGPGCHKEPPERMQPVEQCTVSKGKKESWASSRGSHNQGS